MPPRKSNVSIGSNGEPNETTTEAGPTPSKTNKDGVGIDDLTLPKSMIARLAKGVLPPNTQIQKDALLALHKSATVFVSYIANGANEITQANSKKTIMPQDVITAIKDAEFEGFLPRLQAELKKYNDIQCDKRNSYRHRVKQEKAAAAAVTPSDVLDTTDGTPIGDSGAAANGEDISMTIDDSIVIPASNGNDNGERPSKKLKGTEGAVVLPANGDDSNAGILNNAEESLDDEEDDDDEESLMEEDEDDDVDPEEAESDPESDNADPPDTAINPDGMRDEALDEPDSD